jgi:hypothetical protein
VNPDRLRLAADRLHRMAHAADGGMPDANALAGHLLQASRIVRTAAERGWAAPEVEQMAAVMLGDHDTRPLP